MLLLLLLLQWWHQRILGLLLLLLLLLLCRHKHFCRGRARRWKGRRARDGRLLLLILCVSLHLLLLHPLQKVGGQSC